MSLVKIANFCSLCGHSLGFRWLQKKADTVLDSLETFTALQYILGQLSRLDDCNRSLAIGYRPGDIIMVATTLVQAAVIGARKASLKRIWTI